MCLFRHCLLSCKKTSVVKHSVLLAIAVVALLTLSSCVESDNSCMRYVWLHVGVVSSEHDEVSVEFDNDDEKGRQKAELVACAPQFTCLEEGCAFRVVGSGKPTNLYVIIDGKNLPPHAVTLPSVEREEDSHYVELDATKDPPEWSPVRTLKSCK